MNVTIGTSKNKFVYKNQPIIGHVYMNQQIIVPVNRNQPKCSHKCWYWLLILF